jgi:flagellar basal-body rod protein FlgB
VSIFAADGVGDVLHAALNGISYRESVIANNIANVDTPHFRASSVDFESSLRSAIASGHVDGTNVDMTTSPTLTPVGANDNNVDLRKETMAAMQSVFQYQVVARAVSDRLDMAKTAAAPF